MISPKQLLRLSDPKARLHPDADPFYASWIDDVLQMKTIGTATPLATSDETTEDATLVWVQDAIRRLPNCDRREVSWHDGSDDSHLGLLLSAPNRCTINRNDPLFSALFRGEALSADAQTWVLLGITAVINAQLRSVANEDELAFQQSLIRECVGRLPD